MTKRVRRKNEKLLSWLRACAVAVLTLLPLLRMNFQPTWGAALLSIAVGALMLFAADLGVLVAIIIVALPIMAQNVLLGAVILVLGIAITRFVGSDGSQAFLLVATAVIGAFLGPVWVAPVIAGYLLGAGEGAVAAAIACVTVEVIGILLGGDTYLVGTIAGTPGIKPMLDFSAQSVPANMFSMEWVKSSFGSFGPQSITEMKDYILATKQVPVLVAQPILWGVAAALTGALTRFGRKRKMVWMSFAAAGAGILVIAIASGAAVKALGGEAPKGIALGVLTSLVLAEIVVFLLDRVFIRQATKQKKAPSAMSMAAEDADVDELLRLISTAEERLASQHTTEKTVMITDMKSFSRMTEEDGSMLTAKAIQKHRDLLLPIVQRHGGHGKSTGGDGLVAAFDSAEQAVIAAAEMQQALEANNVAHPNDREMFVRIGIAEGEIVLDKGGRPFLGAALNLAARVMNLADGGQAFVTADVAQKAGAGVTVASLGEFELKNIAKPVHVMEILWAPDQQPVDPRTREAS